MPPKTKKIEEKASRKRDMGSSSAAAAAAAPVLTGSAAQGDADEDHLPALSALLTTAANPRRATYAKRFKEVAELVLSSDATYRLCNRGSAIDGYAAANSTATTRATAGSAAPLSDDYFPTLRVGFMARAMGLNLTSEQVEQLVQLVEDDVASRGTVSRRRLEGVITEALMTGVLGGDSLVRRGVLTEREVPASWQPSCCLREDERTIYNAFAAIDTAGKGYLTVDELRMAMTTLGDPLSAEEMEEMLVAISDPDSNVIDYRDFASILARE